MKKNPTSILRPTSSHTPLFRALRRAARLAMHSSRPGAPPVDELVEMRNARPKDADPSRRRFLKAVVAAPILFSAGGLIEACKKDSNPVTSPLKTSTKIVIVGGGIAGLNAAYQLKKAGWGSTIYDGNTRTGGRIYTAQDIMAPGLATELGGEFIDSDHQNLFDLINDFGLSTLDFRNDTEKANYTREAYYFGGKFYSEAEVVTAFQPFTAQLAADSDSSSDALDNTSVKQYLINIGVTGWLSDMLNVAYCTEYGLDTDQQSSINLLSLITTDVSGGTFDLFGPSDERYHVVGGNQKIVDALAAQVQSQIILSNVLEAVKPNGSGYTLTFKNATGTSVDVSADVVVMCIPFSTLRSVDLSAVTFSAEKMNAINNLGYGTNVKLLVGVSSRVWRNTKYSGYIFTDEKYQCGWDNSWMQPGTAGGFTFYLGGKTAVDAGKSDAATQAMLMMPGLEKAFPGVTAAQNGNRQIFNWPDFKWTKGSYTCWKPGQANTMGADVNGATEGNMYFAGEHCSDEFQGFMNGGAKTGADAAAAILKVLA